MVCVTLLVHASVLLGEVEGPVGCEVVILAQGAEFEDGFGTFQPPAGAGDVHAVLDEVAAGALDDAGGAFPPSLRRLGTSGPCTSSA